ncbi:MAG: FkbM family methyltransferase [Candidatus Methanomethylicaceae archaeon]
MILQLARLVVHTYRRLRIKAMHGQTQWRKVPAGFWMFIDPNEWQGYTILMGYYESDLAYFIDQVLLSGDVAVDIGANQGYIAMLMARAVGITGHVIAIEPVTSTFKKLKQNVRRNKMHQIACVQCAAGDRLGKIDIGVAAKESSYSSILFDKDVHNSYETVRVAPCDTIIAEILGKEALNNIVFVKCDVEGYEPLVLDGMQEVLRRSRPIIWIEVEPSLLAKGGYRPGDIERRLSILGYRFFRPHFYRNAIGIPSLYLESCTDLEANVGSRMANMVAAVPGSKGWQRIQHSKVNLLKEGLL